MKQTPKNVSPMSNEGRNAYVTKQLTNALLALLKDKPLNDISISELCNYAEVGRASFYRNYDSREDIIKAYLTEISHEWTDDYVQNDGMPISRLINTIFTHFENHMEFYRLLKERNLIYLLKDVLIGIFGPKPEHSKTEAYATAFVAYSLYGWIEVWFQRGMQESAEEMAGLFKAQGL
ncbi:MAG: TetR family transcriptional regulator C-terminal domain-containing protein [Muribaculaceae bacterium]|nr:TetR family transcriptional regulator C-terminal domain-containing protein [Muribaculaceae bacterium]